MDVELKGLTKRFDDVVAVDRLDLEINKGEFLVLLGPSGCGKTTALRMIAGLEVIDEGELFIGGRRVNDVLPKYRDVAMVFQSYALYPHMTVRGNIGYPLKLRGIRDPEREEAVRKAAQQVQLEELLDRYPRQLSGGQRQRVALARAIIRHPRVFLMDEPLSNLDAKLRGQMRAELKHLQQELGVTTIYVTHDQIEAMTLASRVAVMNAGVLHQIDTPKNIYNDPANLFVAGFMGSPSMNLISGEVQDKTFQAPGCHYPSPTSEPGKKLVLGVRPEDTQIVSEGEHHLEGIIYSVELTGDQTLVTVKQGEQLITIREDKEFSASINESARIRMTTGRVFFFESESGRRINAT